MTLAHAEVEKNTKTAVVKISNIKGYSNLAKAKKYEKTLNCCQIVAKTK